MTKKTVTLATTLLVAAQGASVQAQEQVNPTGQTVLTTQVTSADVATISAQVDQAKNAVNTQKEVANQAQNDYQVATIQLNEADRTLKQIEQVVSQATPEAIAGLESDIITAKAELTTQTGVVSQTEVNRARAQQSVAVQEEMVLNKSRELTQVQIEVYDAQKAVDLAQANLDGTGAKQVQEELEKAQEAVSQATNELEAAQATVIDADKSDKEKQALVSAKETEAAQLTATLSEANQNLAQATTQAQAAQATLDRATEDLLVATADYEGLNTITLLPDYVTNLKAYAAGTFISDQALEAERRLKALNAQQLSLNTFKVNANDDQTKLDPRHLSQATRQELTHFATDLVNQIRRQMGTPEVSAHSQVIDLAERIADRYEADNWDWTKTITVDTHHKEAIREEAAATGLRAAAHYENIHTIGTMYQPITTLTLSELKEKVYQAVINFMFNGQEYFHAMSISATPGYGQPSRYLGLSFSNRSDAFSIHLIGVSDTSIEDDKRFNRTTVLTPGATATQVVAAYQAAQAQQAVAATSVKETKAAQTVAELVLKNNQAQLDQVSQELATLKARPLALPSAQLVLNQAQDQQTQAIERLARAQEAKDNLTADQATKARLLEEAKQVLRQAQDKLADQQAAVQVEAGKLQERQTALSQAEDKLAQATAEEQALADKVEDFERQRQDLLEAPERLKEVKEKLALATALVKERHNVLEEELAKLQELSEASDKLEAQRAAVLAAYQAYLSSQDKLRQLQQQDRQPQRPPLQVAAPAYGKVSAQQVTPAYGQVAPRASRTLPKTGSRSSVALAFGGLMSVFAALGLVNKRRH